MRMIKFISITIIIIAFFQLPVLFINSENGLIMLRPVIPGFNELVYSYTHSVEKGEVNEYFQVTREGFVLDKTTFTSQGAGLPLDRGEFAEQNGLFVRTGQEVFFPEINIRLARTQGQTVMIWGSQKNMQKWGEPGTRVEFSIMPLANIPGEILTY